MADGTSENEDEDSALKNFLIWCNDNHLILNEKVKVCKQGSCHRYGMIASQDIKENECLFSIPRNLLLEPKTSCIADIVNDLDEELLAKSARGSGWVPLLLALMYEFTNPKSLWRPYLDIVPSIKTLDQPMFWSNRDRKRLLKDTEIADDVEQDLQCIENEYNQVVKEFIGKHEDMFCLKTHTLDLYKHMASFVMAYSFTENGPGYHGNNAPLMVPMADILNHHSNNNAHLEFEKEELRMVSTQSIAKGQEVFNTYGQLANCHLLQSYGFVETTPNPNDSIEISVAMFYEVLQKHIKSKHEARLLDAKFQFMEEMGLISSEDGFVFDLKGCQTGEASLALFLKFLNLSKQELHTLLNCEDKDEDKLSNDLTDLISHFDQCNDEQKLSSYKTLAKALEFKSSKRTNYELSTQSLHETPSKKVKSKHKDYDNHYNKLNGNRATERNSDGKECIAKECDDDVDDVTNDDDDVTNDDDDDVTDGDDDDVTDGDEGEEDVDDVDDDDDDVTDDDVTDDDDDDNEIDDAESLAEEDEQIEHVTYEQIKEFPLTWRKILNSVAKECSSRINVLLKDKKIDCDSSSLSSREQAVRNILCGLRDILHVIMKLESVN